MCDTNEQNKKNKLETDTYHSFLPSFIQSFKCVQSNVVNGTWIPALDVCTQLLPSHITLSEQHAYDVT